MDLDDELAVVGKKHLTCSALDVNEMAAVAEEEDIDMASASVPCAVDQHTSVVEVDVAFAVDIAPLGKSYL